MQTTKPQILRFPEAIGGGIVLAVTSLELPLFSDS
jgi:hypothetical protein